MKKLLLISLCALGLSLCGCGGGGSNSFVGAGNITVHASPDEIDTGDRTKIIIEFDEAHPDGVSIKIRYSKGLSYIADTSILTLKGKEIGVSPFVEVDANIAQSLYLVYFFGRDILGDINSGKLEFELRGVDQTDKNSEIEVDIDVLEDSPSFSADTPEFSAEDSNKLRVK